MATIDQDNIIIRFIAETAKFERDRRKTFRETERQVKQLETGITSGMGSFDRQAGKVQGRFARIADLAGGFLSAQIITTAANALGGLVSRSAELSKNYEQSLISFEVLTGSYENAEALLEKLDQFSLKTPFEPTEINDAAKTLLGFGRGLDQVEDDIRLIGEAAAATGSDLGNLALVFGQVAGVGKLQGQDALQLINAGIPVYQLLEESLGKSTAEIKQLQSKGKITFDILREAFDKAAQEGGKFNGALIKQSKSMSGLLSTAKGAFDTLLRLAGDAFLPIAKQLLPPLIDALFLVVGAVKQVAPLFEELGTGIFAQLVQAVRPVVTAVKDFVSGLDAGVPIMERITGYLTYVVRGMTALGRVMALAINIFKFFYDALAQDATIQSLVAALQTIPQTIGGIVEVAETLPVAFESAFNRVKLTAQAFFADLTNLLTFDLTKLITGEASFADIFNGGDDLRRQAEEQKGLIQSVTEAYERGYQSIEDIKVELPEVATPKAKEEAEQEGVELGEKIAEGVDKGVKEKLSSLSSLSGLTKEISSLGDILKEIDDPTGDGIELLVQAIRDITDQEGKLDRVNDLIDRIRGDKDFKTVELLDNEQLTTLDAAREKVEALLEAGLDAGEAPGAMQFLEDQKAAAKEAAVETLKIAQDLAGQLLDLRIGQLDEEARIQQDQLSFITGLAEKGNAEQVQIERDRLTKIQQEREQAVQKQQQLAAIEITINNAIAASKAIVAITEAFAAGNIPLGIATAASLALTVASTVLTVSQAFGGLPAFRLGVENFDPANPTPDGGGLAILHPGERVLTAEQNAPILRLGVKNSQIPALIEAGMQNLSAPMRVRSPNPSTAELAMAGRIRELEKENRALQEGPDVDVDVIFDEYGMRVVSERNKRKAARRKALRKG